MSWIKRNLYFLIGTVVALLLLGAAGWYGYSKVQLNTANMGELDKAYSRLKDLANQNPHPGSGNVDNVAIAKKQQEQLRDFLVKTRKYFQHIAGVPDAPKVSGQDFTAALSQTIAQLQHEATNSSVALPPDFSFSFTAQRPLLTFATGSLEPLSVQLGEVRAICDVLFHAKVNSIEGIRRERVSDDDAKGPATDYLDQKSVTNELAIITPYELSFRCFSSELASVLSGLATSPYSLIVKSINVDQAPAVTMEPTATPVTIQPQPVIPQQPTEWQRQRQKLSEDQMFRDRYGVGPGGSTGGRSFGQPTPPPPTPVLPTGPAVAPTVSKGGLPTVLDEKQLKVTMMVSAIKLVPSKEK
jgi:hypothetical protein